MTKPPERQTRYECRGQRFDTLEAACDYANRYHRRTGVFVNIRGYKGRTKAKGEQ
jgi:hypothetical protein